jgi:hypothetical protein
MLERYFVWSKALSDEVERYRTLTESRPHRSSDTNPLDAEAYRVGAFIAHWFGSLCPVIEGWQEIRLEDANIDRLLAEGEALGHRAKLFRFRNAAFHFRPTHDDPRFAEFMDVQDKAAAWAVQLERAFERYFRRIRDNAYIDLQSWLDRE